MTTKITTDEMLRLDLSDKFNATLFLIMTRDLVKHPQATMNDLCLDGTVYRDPLKSGLSDCFIAARNILQLNLIKDSVVDTHKNFRVGTVIGRLMPSDTSCDCVVAVQTNDNPDMVYYYNDADVWVNGSDVCASSSDPATVAQVLTALIHDQIVDHNNYRFYPAQSDREITALYRLWKAQIDAANVALTDDGHDAVLDDLPEALTTLMSYLNVNEKDHLSFTVEELADFYCEFKQRQFTAQTANVQQWLHKRNNEDYLTNVVHDVNYPNLANMQLVNPSVDPEVRELVDTISNAPYVNYYEPKLAIKLADKPVANTKHHITLMHGTGDISIIPIILNGLLPASALSRNGIVDFEISGQALGDGVYFVRPDNASKALNFGSNYGSSQHTFVFIADVGYDHLEVTHDGFGSEAQDADTDLFQAKSVGNRGFDEYVCRNYHNITLRYLFIS